MNGYTPRPQTVRKRARKRRRRAKNRLTGIYQNDVARGQPKPWLAKQLKGGW